jgi:hypothetical protein
MFREPVFPEPPFRPFKGHYLPQTPAIDDGRKPTFLSALVQKVGRSLSTAKPESPTIEPDTEPDAEILVRDALVELRTSLPADLDIGREAFENFLRNL